MLCSRLAAVDRKPLPARSGRACKWEVCYARCYARCYAESFCLPRRPCSAVMRADVNLGDRNSQALVRSMPKRSCDLQGIA